MSIILFSLLIIPFCFINDTYPVNGVISNARYTNIINYLYKLVDHINEPEQIIKKYTKQRNNL